MGREHPLDFLVLTPAGACDPTLAIAASRANALGILNLQYCDDLEAARAALARLRRFGGGRGKRIGIHLSERTSWLLPELLSPAMSEPFVVVLEASSSADLAQRVKAVHASGALALLVVLNLEQARRGLLIGVDGLIAKGNESGGWVGEESSFVLLQRLIALVQAQAPGAASTPIWVQGGVGLHSVAACQIAGAAGVVLDSQVLLARVSPLPAAIRDRLSSLDGSETACLGVSLGAQFRAYSRPHLGPLEALSRLEQQLALEGGADSQAAWRERLSELVDWQDLDRHLLAIGQDGCFAAGLAKRFATVGGIIDGLRQSAASHCAVAMESPALAPGSSLALAHGTEFPLVQGPMTRVSDRAAFAFDVAEGGALPLIALALMRAPEVEALLDETSRRLGERPWGVGILGFVPPELRAEQLAVLRTYHPPFVLIAGGRPDQAKALEADGIATYLHVPSPTLLRMYMRDGARRFVFEGRECGGHVGPRTSFVLWDSMVEELLESLPPRDDPSEYHVLFAGGIHDDLSGAMVAAIAAPLVERGVRVGALMGTAYLFTEEVVRSGAITPGFQQAALDCDETVLLVSGPGQATRCLPSPFVDAFESEKRRMLTSGLSAEALKNELEVLNIGRLRIASKGLDRHPDYGRDPSAPRLTSLSDDEQWQRGMYMIGQVAGLHHEVRTIRELHQSVSEGSTKRLSQLELNDDDEPEASAPADIAIVGIGCILPGAANLETFWSNILNKVDAVGEVPESRWDWRNYYDADRSARDKIYSRWGGFIDDVPFDPVAFGMPPASLASIEPFQLLGLLVVQAALKDAGLLDRPFPRERTSVILGAGGGGADLSGNYVVRSSLPELLGEQAEPLVEQLGPALPEWTEDSFPGILMNVAAGRIANRFDFGGTNFTVDAACASSLAAIYLAVRDLQSGNSDVAVAGGVDAIQNPFAFLCFSKTQALSPSGRCRPFDAQADGIAISEGYVAVILKRCADAERDGDRIYALIRGVGSSSDGRDRSMTAPRPEGQIRAMRRAYRQAGFSPATVGLIEAHGTGTVAGDGAEIESLTRFFNESYAGRQLCAVGSVKSMIGHTKAAAGVAGLIKAALALHTRILPPTLGVSEPNPKANFSESPFYVNTETRPWLGGIDGNPRRAGVSAFGFGGTNFHIVLEEYTGNYLPLQRLEPERWPAEILVWHGDSRQAILGQVTALIESLAAAAQPNLADLSYTLATGPAAKSGEMALAIVAESIDDLSEKLRAARSMLAGSNEREHSPAGVHFAERPMTPAGKVAFLFPGQGSQTVNMGRDIAVAFPEAFSTFELADRVLGEAFDRPLSRYIFPPPVFTSEAAKQLRAELTETNIAQPALGVTELAYLKVLRALGVQPEMTAGHSYGEFVALCAAGCFDDDTLLRLSEARGRFMREGAGDESGTMAAVMAGPEALRPLLDDPGLTLANLNAPQQTVVSGSQASIERAIAWAKEHGLRAQQLPVACAFHSPFVAPAQQRLVALLLETSFSAPRFPVYSNTIAGPYPADPGAMVDLLGDHLVRPVDWTSQIQAMYEDGARVFVEAGPRTVLSNLVDQILPDRPHLCLPVEQAGKPGLGSLLNALAALVAEGVPVRLDQLFVGRSPRRLDLNDLAANSKPAHSPTTWLVNGGRARPAAVAVTPASARPMVQVAGLIDRSEPVSAGSNGREERVASASHEAGNGTQSALPPLDTPIDSNYIAESRQYVDTLQTGNGVKPMVTTAPRPIPTNDGGAWESSGTGAPAGQSAYEYNGTVQSRHVSPSWIEGTQPSGAIDRFQDVMRHFLDVQRDVMLSYLQGGQGARGRAPDYRAAPAPRRLAAGTPAPVAAPRPIPTLPAELTVPPAAAPPASVPISTPVPVPASAHQLDPEHRSNDERVAPPGNGLETNHIAAATKPVLEAPSMPEAGAPPDRETITSRLLTIVSERTGYPTEMLDLDADLEADLGIDSIKRVEIVGMITQSLPVPDGMTVDTEQLTTSRTLRQVVDMLVSVFGPEAAMATATEARLPFDNVPSDSRVGRYALRAAELSPANRAGKLAADGVVVIIDDQIGVGAEIERQLTQQGYQVARAAVGQDTGDTTRLAIDPSRPDAAERLRQVVHHQGRASALIYLPALRRYDPAGSPGEDTLLPLFALSQALLPDLEVSAAAGGAAIVGATLMGGTFASVDAAGQFNPVDGAIHGFLKSAAQEWPAIRVKTVDLEPAPAGDLARQLLGELFSTDETVEIGYRSGRRQTLEPLDAPFDHRQTRPALSPESIVLATGGARGITAESLVTLAQAYRPTLLLVGRTEPPKAPEAGDTAGVSEPAELKRAIIEQLHRTSQTVTPAVVETAYRRLLQEREVRDNLARLRETGATIEYFACDVRDASAFGALIDSLYDTYGRIDGVIHGAGVIEDKLIRDKQLASFERVVGTKIDSALTLSRKLRPDSLQFLVFFSSVSGRFGNRGQGDYAAASEVLNKLAIELDRDWPAHVVSINWGPWLKTGMVSPEVRRQFAERGVELITVEQGCRFLHDELRFGRKGEVEIVIGGKSGTAGKTLTTDVAVHGDDLSGGHRPFPSSRAERPSPTPSSRAERSEVEGSAVSQPSSSARAVASRLPLIAVNSTATGQPGKQAGIVRVFDPAVDHYLNDHRIDQHPVLPFAVAIELMAETAAAISGSDVQALRDIQLLHGVVFETEPLSLWVPASSQDRLASTSPEVAECLSLEIDGDADPAVVHYRALADLVPTGSLASSDSELRLAPLEESGPFPLSVEEAYRTLLFHGPTLQGIVSIGEFSPLGTRASLRPSVPAHCIHGAPETSWLFDPVLVDSAFQLQVLWARVSWGMTLLPAKVECARRYQPLNDGSAAHTVPLVRHEMRIRPESRPPLCHADHSFFDPDGKLLCQITDAVGVGSTKLNRLGGTR